MRVRVEMYITYMDSMFTATHTCVLSAYTILKSLEKQKPIANTKNCIEALSLWCIDNNGKALAKIRL